MTQPRYFRAARMTAASLAVGAMLLTGCTANVNKTSTSDAGANASAFLTIPREDMGTFVQNFNPFAPTVNPMAQQAIYESLPDLQPGQGRHGAVAGHRVEGGRGRQVRSPSPFATA